MVRPLPGDHHHKILIEGEELVELKKHTYSMCEAFGLDRKIESYQGIRPMTLYRWDIECLLDVTSLALEDKAEYPDATSDEYLALSRLQARLREEYGSVYGNETNR